jgi:hypothetical protein
MLDHYVKLGIPELKELAETVVSTDDYARWKDKTGSAYETAMPRAIENLTGMPYYKLPEGHPYKGALDVPYRSQLPEELREETEKVYSQITDGDTRKLRYYQSGTEIWARMMEQYVYTKLAEVGIVNPYLTQLTYDIDVMDQFMEEKTFEEKVKPIMDRLFARFKERQLTARRTAGI